MLILLSGLPGVGKSSLARAFCAGGRAVHLRVDTIEAAVTASALRPASAEDAGYRVAAAQAVEMVAGGHVVVVDAVNADPEGRAIWGPATLVMEVVCSDPEAHRVRVERRRAEAPPGTRVPDWPAVAARRWVPWDPPVPRLDTAVASAEALATRLRSVVDGMRGASGPSDRGSSAGKGPASGPGHRSGGEAVGGEVARGGRGRVTPR